MLETSRRKTLDFLNSRYIYGRVVSTLRASCSVNLLTHEQPLLHSIIFIIELAMAARLMAKFNSYYASRPLITTMITNAVSCVRVID